MLAVGNAHGSSTPKRARPLKPQIHIGNRKTADESDADIFPEIRLPKFVCHCHRTAPNREKRADELKQTNSEQRRFSENSFAKIRLPLIPPQLIRRRERTGRGRERRTQWAV